MPRIVPNQGRGRPKGIPNKIPAALKEMVLKALEDVGGVKYLKRQALENPQTFMTLIGRVLPYTIVGDPNAPLNMHISWGDDA